MERPRISTSTFTSKWLPPASMGVNLDARPRSAGRAELLHRCRELVQACLRRIPRARVLVLEIEEAAGRAGRRPAPVRACVARGAPDRHRNAVASRVRSLRLEGFHATGELFDIAEVVRNPRVAEGDHPLVHGPAVAADEDGWMRLLHRFRPGPDAIEAHVLALIARLLGGPDLAHGLDALAHQPEAALRIGPVVSHLLEVPSSADPEQEAPAGDAVESCDLLRADDRISLDDEAEPGAYLEVLR